MQPGPKLQQRKVELVAKPEQVVAPGPVNPPGCTTFSDSALEATKGLLCATQFVARNVTKSKCIVAWRLWSVGAWCNLPGAT